MLAGVEMEVGMAAPYFLRMNLNFRPVILDLNVLEDCAWLHIVILGIVVLMGVATNLHLASCTVVMVRYGLVQHQPAKDKQRG